MSLNNEELREYFLRDMEKIFRYYEIESIDVNDNLQGEVKIKIEYVAN